MSARQTSLVAFSRAFSPKGEKIGPCIGRATEYRLVFFFILCDGSKSERALYISGERRAGRRCLAWVACVSFLFVFVWSWCLDVYF